MDPTDPGADKPGLRGGARYDRIGVGYASKRREDPDVRARIESALGDARSVVNVGAGTGSYEPSDRLVFAVEPSDVMIAQRRPGAAPATKAIAQDLPFDTNSVDAAMCTLSLHHWDGQQRAGVYEMRRIARDSVVILTCDPEVCGSMWLMRDYLPEVADLDRQLFPSIARIREWLGGESHVEVVPVSSDTPDGTLLSFWAHPERVLDASARQATSGFARMPSDVVERVVRDVRRDLQSGAWDARNGHLRSLRSYDAGLRLVVDRPAGGGRARTVERSVLPGRTRSSEQSD